MFWSREAEKKARGDQASLKDSIEAQKIRTEKDTMKASMEIARLKDDLLESRLTIDHIFNHKVLACTYISFRRVSRGEELFIEKLEVSGLNEQVSICK